MPKCRAVWDAFVQQWYIFIPIPYRCTGFIAMYTQYPVRDAAILIEEYKRYLLGIEC